MADVERSQSPEERERDLKRTELVGLESELVERELELSTLQQELAVFEAEYIRVVGRRYAMLDNINARTAEAEAVRHPDDQASLEEARNARETADVSVAQAEGDVPDAETALRFEPPAGLKALYRAAARKLHPDLATTDDERARRHEWMAKVNEAYRQENEDALNTVLADWETSPESVPGTGIPNELVRVIRQIAQVRRRIDEIGLIIAALQAGDLYALYAQCNTQAKTAGNSLDELAAHIDEQIADARRRLAELEDPQSSRQRQARTTVVRSHARREEERRTHSRAGRDYRLRGAVALLFLSAVVLVGSMYAFTIVLDYMACEEGSCEGTAGGVYLFALVILFLVGWWAIVMVLTTPLFILKELLRHFWSE